MNGGSEREMAPRLPQKAETEKAILGAVLVNDGALSEASALLNPSDFFVSAHRRIFSVMQGLAEKGQPVELVTLCDALRDDSEVCALGGPAYLAALNDGIYQRAPVAHWATIVRDAAYLRGVAYTSESLLKAALKPDAKAE